jgi:hypothetical protein
VTALLDAPPLLMLVLVVLVLALATLLMFAWPGIDARRIGRRADEVRWEAEVEARADREHNLWMSGDPRGLHGEYPPHV